MTLLFRSWGDESVIYDSLSSNIHLVSFFNAELLALVKQDISSETLAAQISVYYKIDKNEAKAILDNLTNEYQKSGLLD